MHDIQTLLGNLKRPRLLVRTARIGAEDYRRDMHLPRALGSGRLPRPAQAIMQLMDIEKEQNEMRRSRSAHYSAMRHVDVLIALMGEARALREVSMPRVLKSVV